MKKPIKELLLLDDDPDFTNVVRVLVKSENYRVHWVNNEKKAFQLLEKMTPHLAILDLSIVSETEFLLLQYLSKNSRFRDTSICIASSSSEKAVIQDIASRRLVSNYFVKPLARTQFVSFVKRTSRQTPLKEISFEKSQTLPNLKLTIPGKQSMLSEAGFCIDGPFVLRPEHPIKIDCKTLELLKLSLLPMKTASATLFSTIDHCHRNKVVPYGITENTAKTIRKIVRQWK